MTCRRNHAQDKDSQDDRLAVLLALNAVELARSEAEVVGQSAEVGPCPGAEAIAAFAEGRLEVERRASVLAHLDRCPTCYRQLLAFSLARQAHNETGGDLEP